MYIYEKRGRSNVPGGWGGVLWGEKDRDDCRKSYKTTLKILSHKNLHTLKHTPWSKINQTNTNKPEFIKETYSKELYLW